MATIPTVVQIPLDTSRIVALGAQYQGWERYERDQHHVVITAAAFSFPFFLTNIDAGGASAGLSFAYPKYGLLFNGVERATYTPVIPWRGFVKGVGYPVFDNSSLDDDPLTAVQGYVNRGLLYRNVVETPTGFACDVSCTLGAVTVDVYPHSDVFVAQVSAPQHVTIPAGQWVAVSFAATQQAPVPPVTPVPPDPLQAQLDAANATIAQLTADKAALAAHLALLGADVDAIVAAAAKAKADE